MKSDHDITRVTAIVTVTKGQEITEGNQCPKCKKFYKTDLTHNQAVGADTCVRCLLDMNFERVGKLEVQEASS